LLLFNTVAAAGCFSPHYDDGGLQCSVVGQRCPSGYSCVGNHCYRSDHLPTDAAPRQEVDAGSGTMCMPAPEVCNGIDDDCDGIVDNGCPVPGSLLVFNASATSDGAYIGKMDGAAFDFSCPPGQVVTGFHGRSGSAIDAIGVHCGAATVQEDRGSAVYAYSIAVTDMPPALGPSGGPGGAGFDLLCQQGEIVTGVAVSLFKNAQSVSGFQFTCTKMVIAGSPGAMQVRASDSTEKVPPGGPLGALAIQGDYPGSVSGFDCPITSVAYRLSGNATNWVNGLKGGCFAPKLQLR
jgi:hypothetical protein